MSKAEKSPIANALGSCLDCPSDHALRRAAVELVVTALKRHRYKSEAALSLGVSLVYLSRLLGKHPELKTKEFEP